MDPKFFSIWIALCVLFLCYLVSRKKRLVKNPKRLPLPPGPPGWPIIGNLFDISNSWLWVSYSSMAQKYGRFLSAHFRVAPHDIVARRHCPPQGIITGYYRHFLNGSGIGPT